MAVAVVRVVLSCLPMISSCALHLTQQKAIDKESCGTLDVDWRDDDDDWKSRQIERRAPQNHATCNADDLENVEGTSLPSHPCSRLTVCR